MLVLLPGNRIIGDCPYADAHGIEEKPVSANGSGFPGIDTSPFAISLTLPANTRLPYKDVTGLNMQVVKWCVDLAMGIAFLFCAVTGFFKFTLLMRIFGLTNIVLPLALMSDIHDRAGIILCFLVAVHLFLNRSWILSMTRNVLAGTPDTP